MNILVVIPARGGSKGIPRKNLRSLAGKPLLSYSIKTALASRYQPDVYVSSDDEEILSIAKQLGAKTHQRDPQIAQDTTTLDPVIFDTLHHVEQLLSKQYDLVVTLQPTSPLLESASVDAALQQIIEDEKIETIIAAEDDTHLTWLHQDDRFLPNYKERVNRQYLTPVFKETGGFLITRRSIVTETNRIGKEVELYLLEGGEKIDIDTYEDWNLCEYYLRRKKILFVVSGYSEIGLGHVYNTLLVANDILNHNVEFLVDNKSVLAYEKIAANHYTVHMQQSENIVDDIARLSPQMVINDRLNTTTAYMQGLKDLGVKVVNFEDNGEGIAYADLVINAIYPEQEVTPSHYYGYKYFLLRDEFLLTQPRVLSEEVKEVLVTFGGVDSNNYTHKVITAINDYCQEHQIHISVVAGFGYTHYESLASFSNISVVKNAKNIAMYMHNADFIFTSAGRTTYEIASLAVPTIVLAQNERELTHRYASETYGFKNLGLGCQVNEEKILATFIERVEDPSLRHQQRELMQRLDLRSGRKRTLYLINEVMESL